MREKKALLLAALLFLLALFKLALPGQSEALRAWAGRGLGREWEQTVEAWGRSLTDREERIAALSPENSP